MFIFRSHQYDCQSPVSSRCSTAPSERKSLSFRLPEPHPLRYRSPQLLNQAVDIKGYTSVREINREFRDFSVARDHEMMKGSPLDTSLHWNCREREPFIVLWDKRDDTCTNQVVSLCSQVLYLTLSHLDVKWSCVVIISSNVCNLVRFFFASLLLQTWYPPTHAK